MAKSMKLGGGGRFAAFTNKLQDEGYSEKVSSAIAASAGRQKYGNKRMSNFSSAAKRRLNSSGK